jgi:hypothetical protein
VLAKGWPFLIVARRSSAERCFSTCPLIGPPAAGNLPSRMAYAPFAPNGASPCPTPVLLQNTGLTPIRANQNDELRQSNCQIISKIVINAVNQGGLVNVRVVCLIAQPARLGRSTETGIERGTETKHSLDCPPLGSIPGRPRIIREAASHVDRGTAR